MYSNVTSGLFHRAVLFSPNNFPDFAFRGKEKEAMVQFGARLNCDTETDARLVSAEQMID